MEIKKETSFSGLEKEGNELFNINHSFELEKDGISTFLGIGVSGCLGNYADNKKRR